MRDDDVMEFECMNCGTMFRDRLFDITREYDRVIYRRPPALDEVAIECSEGIGGFCSASCREAGRSAVMTRERVPVLAPPERPGINPVEICARCKGPVDMSDWHLTYLENEFDTSTDSFTIHDLKYTAVLCKKCVPPFSEGLTTAEEEEPSVQGTSVKATELTESPA
jgi:hypothetical protein